MQFTQYNLNKVRLEYVAILKKELSDKKMIPSSKLAKYNKLSSMISNLQDPPIRLKHWQFLDKYLTKYRFQTDEELHHEINCYKHLPICKVEDTISSFRNRNVEGIKNFISTFEKVEILRIESYDDRIPKISIRELYKPNHKISFHLDSYEFKKDEDYIFHPDRYYCVVSDTLYVHTEFKEEKK
jgi:hypothetical protein